MAETICFISTAIAVANGFGRSANSLTEWDMEMIGRSTFVTFIVGFWASGFGRISVACLLLQFTQAWAWRAALWAMITLQVLLMVGCDLTVLLQCRPIRATWAQVPGAKCLSPEDNWKMGYSFTGVSMFSDVLFAVMPIALVWRLSRSPVERLLLSVLLGLGLLGVVTGAIRVVTLSSFHLGSENVVADMMPVYLWSRIEEIVIISAACAPLLKGPIEGILHRRFGWFLSSSTPPRTPSSVQSLPPGVSGRCEYACEWSRGTTLKTCSTETGVRNVESKQGTQGTQGTRGAVVSVVATPTPALSSAKSE